MAFFSGYPLLYSVVLYIGGTQLLQKKFAQRMIFLLPYAYALVGTLYLGLQLRNLYPDYSIDNIKMSMQSPYLTIWGLCSILFWIPIVAQKKNLSLLHGLFFFFILVKDLILQTFSSSTNSSLLKNEMNIYTDSLLINFGALTIMLALCYLFDFFKRR